MLPFCIFMNIYSYICNKLGKKQPFIVLRNGCSGNFKNLRGKVRDGVYF